MAAEHFTYRVCNQDTRHERHDTGDDNRIQHPSRPVAHIEDAHDADEQCRKELDEEFEPGIPEYALQYQYAAGSTDESRGNIDQRTFKQIEEHDPDDAARKQIGRESCRERRWV